MQVVKAFCSKKVNIIVSFSSGVVERKNSMNGQPMMNGNTIVVGRKLSSQPPKDQVLTDNDSQSFNLKDRETSSRRGSEWARVMLNIQFILYVTFVEF